MFKTTDVNFGLNSPKVVLLFLAPYLFAYLFEYGVVHVMGTKWVAYSVFDLTFVYQKLITAGPRELRQNYTALVDINPVTDKIWEKATKNIGSPCGKKGEGTRNALAKLLKKINEQKPAEIVIDKYFPVACLEGDRGTQNLKEALQSISQQTPIVIGRHALTPEQLKETGSAYSEKNPVLEIAQTSLKFNNLSESNIVEGIVNLDLDNRKMALKWLVRLDEKSQPEEISTLSYAAVTTFYTTQSEPSAAKVSGIEKTKAKYPRIKKLFELDKNPYISFIEKSKFEIIAAGKLIATEPPENFLRLRGKIVVIGESGNLNDMHDSVFGRQIPGFILQANYIEAVLDQRYYESNFWLDYLIGFFVFVAVYYCGQQEYTATKFFIYLVLILGGVFLLLYLPVALVGIYINPVTISSLAISIIFAHQFFPKNKSQQTMDEKDNRRVIK